MLGRLDSNQRMGDSKSPARPAAQARRGPVAVKNRMVSDAPSPPVTDRHVHSEQSNAPSGHDAARLAREDLAPRTQGTRGLVLERPIAWYDGAAR